MPEYLVRWEMEIDADSEREAAEEARAYQAKPDSTAVVFDVFRPDGQIVRVDLLDEDEFDAACYQAAPKGAK